MLESVRRDLRLAARMLARNRGFACIAILSIAIGVGANAAMFSVADGLILRPLPVPRPGTLITVSATSPAGEILPGGVSYSDYLDLRTRAQSFDGLVASRGIVATFGGRPDEPAQSRFGLAVSANLFDVIEVAPAVGRAFVAASSASGDAVVGNFPGISATMAEVVSAIEAALPDASGLISWDDAALPFPAELEAEVLESTIGPVSQPSLTVGVAETVALLTP